MPKKWQLQCRLCWRSATWTGLCDLCQIEHSHLMMLAAVLLRRVGSVVGR